MINWKTIKKDGYPEDTGALYIVASYRDEKRYYYQLCQFTDNLYSKSKYDFTEEDKRPGFYYSDSELGYIEVKPRAYYQMEEYDPSKDYTDKEAAIPAIMKTDKRGWRERRYCRACGKQLESPINHGYKSYCGWCGQKYYEDRSLMNKENDSKTVS